MNVDNVDFGSSHEAALVQGCIVNRGDALVWVLDDGSHIRVVFDGFTSLDHKLWCSWTDYNGVHRRSVDIDDLRVPVSRLLFSRSESSES